MSKCPYVQYRFHEDTLIFTVRCVLLGSCMSAVQVTLFKM